MENSFIQKFNYNIHAPQNMSLKDFFHKYIIHAKSMGIMSIGFSENIANSSFSLPNKNDRVLLSNLDEYINLIKQEKELNPDMSILVGLETEYDATKETFLKDLRTKVDYMILGQHSITDKFNDISGENNPNYPIQYAHVVSKAIERGIFDVVAHPDYFMKYRDTIQTEEGKKEFNRNALIASQIICGSAAKIGIPLEINLDCVVNDIKLDDGNYAYPSIVFWSVAKDTPNLKVMYSADKSNLKVRENAINKIPNIMNLIDDKLIKDNYNPVVNRQSNPILKEHFSKNDNNILTYEAHLVDNLLRNSEDVDTSLNEMFQKFMNESKLRTDEILNEINRIQNDNTIPTLPKSEILNRKKEELKEIELISQNRQRLIDYVKNSVNAAVNMGCQTREEYANISSQIAEYNSTNSKEQKSKIEENIQMFKNFKSYDSNQDIGNSGLEQSTQLRRSINGIKANDYQGYNGFAKPLLIILMLVFIFGFAVGMAYALVRIKIG